MHPKTEIRPVVDRIHGHEVIDPYRWLEEGESPATQEWSAQQRAFTAHTIGQYGMKASLKERFGHLKERPEIHAPTGRQDTLLYQGRDGQPAHVDRADLSHDGRYVLFGISHQGDKWATLKVYDLDQQKLLGDRIQRRVTPRWLLFPDSQDFLHPLPTPRGIS